MSSPSLPLPLGQVIGSRYRVQSLIGRGGMGMVYAAMHELTGRRVAIKVMLSDTDDAPVLHDRFLSEARIAATVRHPNIVDVLDMGLHGGSPFLVMELLEGLSLEQVLKQHKQLAVEQALIWLLPIIGALAVLHDAGIVHRDVKPSNIHMSSLPRHPMRPKLLDFGLARVVSDLRLTRSGTVIGTPLYMAPEHAAGLATGAQADIWSIGVVLFESLAGCSPFNYVDRSSLALQVLAGLVRPLSELRPDLPPAICTVVSRALQRDLSRRYPDMRSFAHALHAAARVSGIPLPADPDPIGLPDYVKWQRGDLGAATTHEHIVPQPTLAPSHGSGGAPRVVDAQRTPGPDAGYSSLAPRIDSTGSMQRRSSLRWLSLGALLVLLALGTWWLRAQQASGPVAMPQSLPTTQPVQALGAAPVPMVESLAERTPVQRPEAGAARLEQALPTGPRTDTPEPARASEAALRSPSSRRRSSSSRRVAPDEPGAGAVTPVSKPAKKPTKSDAPTDEVESEWK